MKTRVLTVFALFVSLALSSAQTISNPSFESNSFTASPGYYSQNGNGVIVGWVASGTTGLNPAGGSNPFADNGTVPDGTNVAFIQSNNTNLNSSLSTVISNLTVGETYKVNFRVNAQTNVGGMPNLNVWIDATNVVNSTVTPVAPMGFPGPYKYFAFDFTAAATNHTMTLSNDASNDQTVLLDNFSIALRNSGWSYAAWSNDASSGVSSNRTYTHAYSFGSSSNTTINGVIFTGIAGSNPSSSSNGVFSTAGLPNVFNNDTNILSSGTGGSSELARDFVFGGAVESITIQGLTIGKAYVATIYSVGFDYSGARAATFSAGNDRLTVNQNQFGDYNGIRVSCYFTANATSNTLSYVPLNLGATFHTYGFSVYQVPERVVTNAADSGPGSLRQLVSQADLFTLITFTNTLSGQTIVLLGGQLTISNNLTIDASILPAGIALSGNRFSRIFEVSPGATLGLNALTLTNAESIGNGGAILVDAGGTLTLNNSTLSGNAAVENGGALGNFAGMAIISNSAFSDNSAFSGGAIENDNGTLIIGASTLSGNVSTNVGGAIDNNAGALLRLDNSTLAGNSTLYLGGGGGIENSQATAIISASTLSGNASANNGGAIDNDYGALLRLDNSTLASNSAVSGGGGIENFQATAIINNSTISTNSAGGAGGINNFGMLVLTNTIVAGNTAPSLPDLNLDPSGTFAGANNLTNGNPLLAALGNYGGPTQTMPPLAGSPAIDAGTDSVTNFLATDQRGFPRLIGAHVDIGAVEYFASPLVTNTADAGSGSLRDAAEFTTNGATITFTNTLSGQTILLTNGELQLNQNVTIDASSLPAGVTVSGNQSNRIFEVSPGATLSLNALTLTNGYAASGGGGGAILVDNGGALTLTGSTLSGNTATGVGGAVANGGLVIITNSTLSGNAAAYAGAIENDNGTLLISASTLSGNVATNNGGAIDNDAGALLRLDNSTLAGNSASGGGGAIENFQATAIINNSTISTNSAGGAGGINNFGMLVLTNTIVAGNTAPSLPDLNLDPSGTFAGANNLTNGNPLLAPLGTYGGPTQTMPPLTGSPAIDAGTDSVTNFLATDQRGFPRLSGAHVDIGAVEVQFVAVPANNPPVLKNVLWTSAGGTNAFQFSFTNVPSADFTALASTNVSLPLSNWTVLGNIPEISSGQYQFTDSATTNFPQRFYQVVSP